MSLAVAAFLAIAACQSTPPAISDPKQILTQSLLALQKAKTVHLAATLDGAVPLVIGSSTSPIALDGSTANADLDLAGSRFRATFLIPTLFGLTGEAIAVDGMSYLKTTFTGPKYIASPTGVGSRLGVSPSAGASSSADRTAGLLALLTGPGVTATKNADAQCGSKTCYQVTVVVTPDAVSPSPAAAPGGSALPGSPALPGGFAAPVGSALPGFPGLPSLPVDLSGATVTFVVTVEKDTLRPASVSANATMAGGQALKATLTTSNWDAAVSIQAPPADQIGQGSGGLQLPFPLPSGLPFALPSG
ncbi:MAG TPA: hypothetical protein VIM30_02065 [Candidatus Limnocylindrales bacterium]